MYLETHARQGSHKERESGRESSVVGHTARYEQLHGREVVS